MEIGNFLNGRGSCFNLPGNYYSSEILENLQKYKEIYLRTDLTPQEKDRKALLLDREAITSDWKTIGKDITEVLKNAGKYFKKI